MPHSFTPQEEAARARSLGVSILQFRSLSQAQREQGASVVGTFGTRVLLGEDDGVPLPPFPDPTGVGGATLSFAQTEAGARLAASLAQDVERFRGRERLKLEGVLQSLAMELLPPGDVETAMKQVRRGELVKSKLAFQAVLESLDDAARNEERRRDLDLAEENERRTLRQARSRIVIDMLGRDLGRAILFGLSGSGGGGE